MLRAAPFEAKDILELDTGQHLQHIDDNGFIDKTARDRGVALLFGVQLQSKMTQLIPKLGVAHRLKPVFQILNISKLNHTKSMPDRPGRLQTSPMALVAPT